MRRSSSVRTAWAKLTRRPDGGRAVLVDGLEAGLRVADRGPRDRERLGVVEDRTVGGEGERTEVEVVDGLLDQVVEVLDEAGARVGVARDPERVEDHRAELVGGGDRRGVEAGQRLGDPAVAQPALLGVPPAQQGDQLRVGGRVDARDGIVAEHPLGLDQLGPDPLAELLAGRPAEGDDEHLLQPGDPLGDVAGHQRADGPGLAGAGARLEQDGAGGQRVPDVEGAQGRFTAAPPSLRRSAAAPRSARRASPRPASSSSVTGAPGPWTRRW